MSSEKQIEEMAEIICGNFENGMCKMYYNCKHNCGHINTAKSLYKAGYRKQSEGEWISVEGDVIFKCSICDAEISTSWDYENNDMWGFCPCCGANMKGGTEIVYKPVADVVPRSESARDLEALEKTVTEIYNRYVFEDNDYAEDDVAREAVMNALTDVSNAIYELKEKYTKGGEG